MDNRQSWPTKFAVAISGLIWSVRNQNSFMFHVPITLAVLGVAAWLRLEPWRWVALIFAISIVFCSELLNTSIECLVKVVHPDHDPRIGRVLDIAAGAVLFAALAAVIVGLITIGPPLLGVVNASP